VITIGMPSYGNPEQVWYTLLALRLYQDLDGCEIVVVDNKGDDRVRHIVKASGVKYDLCNSINGPGPAKNRIFEIASKPFVLIIDSHVMLYPASIKRLKAWLRDHQEDAKNLIHGPLVLTSLKNAYTHYENKWRGHMWGIWPQPVRPETLDHDGAFEIEMMGTGLIGCRKDSWLGFHAGAKGFAGIEGVIQAKYRKAGRKVLCLPFLRWVHWFKPQGEATPYPNYIEDRIRNFLLGFNEVGLDPAPIYEHFGRDQVQKVKDRMG
jgi:glycosyltransferase involved in cell wall biosynthesis